MPERSKVTAYPFRTTEAKLVEVIQVTDNWGSGTEEDPVRRVVCFFDKKGYCLAVHDSIHPHEKMLEQSSRGM